MFNLIKKLFHNKADVDDLGTVGEETFNQQEDEYISPFADIAEPRAAFTIVGIEEGRIKVQFDWNKPFINTINKMGFIAETEEESVQLFFYASAMRPMNISETVEDLTAPEIRLSNEQHRLVE